MVKKDKSKRDRNKGANERHAKAREALGVERRPNIPSRPSKTKVASIDALSNVNRKVEKERLLRMLTDDVQCLPEENILTAYEPERP